MLNFVSSWLRNRDAIRALSALSDRELADVGIDRAQVKATVAQASARARSSDQGASAMASSWGAHNRRSLIA